MEFGDLNTSAGQAALNEYLSNKSYIKGHTPTQADASVFHSLGNFSKSSFVHLNRWYEHIQSYENDLPDLEAHLMEGASCDLPDLINENTGASSPATPTSTKNKDVKGNSGKSKKGDDHDEGDTQTEILEALRSKYNADQTPKTEAQIKKDLKKLEKLEKFMAKQAKLELAKAQKDSKPKPEEKAKKGAKEREVIKYEGNTATGEKKEAEQVKYTERAGSANPCQVMKWNYKREDDLIDLWEDRACLYDNYDDGYRKPAVKRQAIKEIATSLGITVKEVTDKMTLLKKEWREARKPLPGGMGYKAPSRRKVWVLRRLTCIVPLSRPIIRRGISSMDKYIERPNVVRKRKHPEDDMETSKFKFSV